MLLLQLTRKYLTAFSTIGEIYIQSEFQCYSLEDQVRSGPKVVGKTAIPYGTYDVIVSYSNRFKRRLPLLLDVPEFEGIRIHPGNSPADTSGCILVGRTRGVDWIGESRLAFDPLYLKILEELAIGGKVEISILELDEG